MLPKPKQMYKDAKQLHHLLYQDSVHLGTEVNECSLGEQVDTVYSLKKTEELLEDLRKELTKVRKRIELRVCLSILAEGADKVSTPYCSAKVKISQFASVPHKRRNDPDAYDALMKSMGVPEELIGSEALRPNWEGFNEWFTAMQAAGKPLPDGIDPQKVYTEHELQTRKKKDPDEED